jgi:DNA-binding transcriptional regulator YdaS (Cro superfamily)
MNKPLSPEKQALRRAAAVLGGQAALADLLGYKDRRNVWAWFNDPSRELLAEHCPTIERATRAKGEIVKCEELRPDIDWKVFRLREPHEWEDTAPDAEREAS